MMFSSLFSPLRRHAAYALMPFIDATFDANMPLYFAITPNGIPCQRCHMPLMAPPLELPQRLRCCLRYAMPRHVDAAASLPLPDYATAYAAVTMMPSC